jgi:hypothetical protein
MASQPNITLPDPILSAVQEEADRQHKSLNEMVGELVMIGLHKRKKSLLAEVLEEGRQNALDTLGHIPDEEEILAAVERTRQARRR